MYSSCLYSVFSQRQYCFAGVDFHIWLIVHNFTRAHISLSKQRFIWILNRSWDVGNRTFCHSINSFGACAFQWRYLIGQNKLNEQMWDGNPFIWTMYFAQVLYVFMHSAHIANERASVKIVIRISHFAFSYWRLLHRTTLSACIIYWR